MLKKNKILRSAVRKCVCQIEIIHKADRVVAERFVLDWLKQQKLHRLDKS